MKGQNSEDMVHESLNNEGTTKISTQSYKSTITITKIGFTIRLILRIAYVLTHKMSIQRPLEFTINN